MSCIVLRPSTLSLPIAIVVGIGAPACGCAASKPPLEEPTRASPEISKKRPSVEFRQKVAGPKKAAPDEETAFFADPRRQMKINAALPRIGAFVERRAAASSMPGLAFGVVVDGQLVYRKMIGTTETGAPIDENSIFRVGSITKSFTAQALLLLRDRRQLSLELPMEDYLPEISRLIYPTADSPKLNLKHVLTHSSGLPHTDPWPHSKRASPSEALALSALTKLRLVNVPGATYSYSSFGFTLGGLTVARRSGRAFSDFVGSTILKPLGMRKSVFRLSRVPKGRLAPGHDEGGRAVPREGHWKLGVGNPAGGLYSSLSDMARWLGLHLDAYPERNAPEQVLKRASLRESHRLHHFIGLSSTRGTDQTSARARATGTGYGWFVRQDCDHSHWVTHSGAMKGYFATLAFLPEHGVGVIALTNSRVSTESLASQALKDLVSLAHLQPRVRSYNPALPGLVRDALKLAHEWSDGEYERLFADSFRSQLGVQAWRSQMEKMRKLGGDCRLTKVLSVRARNHARFAFQCKKGSVSAGGQLYTNTSKFDSFGWSRLTDGELATRCRK